MKNNLKKILGLFLASFLFVGCAAAHPTPAPLTLNQQATSLHTNLQDLTDRTIIPITVGNYNLNVEVVNTTESITQGLSGREAIGADGMLFVMPSKRIQTFWMKEMKFSLDIIWIDENSIVDITQNVPHPDSQTSLTELPVYSPQQPVNLVLELPAGTAQEQDLAAGDEVVFHLERIEQ